MIHRLVVRGLLRARSAPDILLYGLGALVWAMTGRVHHAYRTGIIHGLNITDRWLQMRDPQLAKEWREYARTISKRHQ